MGSADDYAPEDPRARATARAAIHRSAKRPIRRPTQRSDRAAESAHGWREPAGI